MNLRLGWKAFMCACLVVGALLRFGWIGDVEYKDDEDQLFDYSQAVPAAHLWPAIGTTSGVRGIRHPALGTWSFAVLAGAFHLNDPLALTRSVQGLSLIALGLLFWFAWRVAPGSQREVWLWTAALASVNFAAVVYARKIWIPDLLPFFSTILLIAWWYRQTSVGALVWGLTGALIGQIQMTGFFYAVAVVVGTALFARANVRWRAWLAGSAWGAIPLLPWLSYMWLYHVPHDVFSSTSPRALLDPGFFRIAFEIGVSQTAEFNLGNHFQEYLTFPVLFGVPTRGVGVARLLLLIVGTMALVALAAVTLNELRGLRAGRRLSDTSLCLVNGAIAGLLFSLAGVANAPNHHLMMFPLEVLWIPLAVLSYVPKPRIWLTAIWLGSIVCTFGFLQFIHTHCGAPEGDYGIAYRCQDHGKARASYLVPLIRPGQEDIVARMLGRGEVLPGGCRFTRGQIERAVVDVTYACDAGEVPLQMIHPSKAPDDAPRTREFAVVVEGSPPPGFVAALVEQVRRHESAFEWLLEAGPETSSIGASSGPPPHGYLPVLTSRQVLARLVAGGVILLLLSPWWAPRATLPTPPQLSTSSPPVRASG